MVRCESCALPSVFAEAGEACNTRYVGEVWRYPLLGGSGLGEVWRYPSLGGSGLGEVWRYPSLGGSGLGEVWRYHH